MKKDNFIILNIESFLMENQVKNNSKIIENSNFIFNDKMGRLAN